MKGRPLRLDGLAVVAVPAAPVLVGQVTHCSVNRVIVAADNPWLVPRNCSNAGAKSLVARPCRYSSGNASAICGDFRAQAGRIAEEPASLPGGLVDALVIDPRRPHRDRAGRGGHLPLGVVAVANHQPLPVHVDLAGMGLDEAGHLGSPSRTIASNSDELTAEPLAASRPAPSWTTLSMGVPSRTDAPNAGPDQNLDHFQVILGKVRPSTSPHRGPNLHRL